MSRSFIDSLRRQRYLCCLYIISVTLVIISLQPFLFHVENDTPSANLNSGIDDDKTKVALVVLYTNNALPSWFETFALTTELSSSKFEWVIFTIDTYVDASKKYRNIRVVELDRSDLLSRLSSLLLSNSSDLSHLLHRWPYFLVELKPCFGELFEDYLRH